MTGSGSPFMTIVIHFRYFRWTLCEDYGKHSTTMVDSSWIVRKHSDVGPHRFHRDAKPVVMNFDHWGIMAPTDILYDVKQISILWDNQ